MPPARRLAGWQDRLAPDLPRETESEILFHRRLRRRPDSRNGAFLRSPTACASGQIDSPLTLIPLYTVASAPCSCPLKHYFRECYKWAQ